MTENNDDMEVENILSSIKGILEEDAENQNGIPSSGEEKSPDVLETVLNEEDSDIIELSDDMRIGGNEFVDDNAIEDNSPLGSAIDEIDREDGETSTLQSAETTVAQDFIDESVRNNSETGEITTGVVSEPEEAAVETQSVEPDPTVEQEPITTEPEPEAVATEPEPEAVATEPEPEVVATEPGSEAVATEPEPETVATEPEPEAVATEPESEAVATEPESEAVAAEAEPEAVATEPEPVEQVEIQAEGKNDAVDASANIISNFAKIFAKGKDNTENTEEKSEPEITAIGNANKTLESFVEDAIVKVIGKDIAKEWNNGADYRNIAEAEIKAQVKAWVDNNLSSMVEKIIKSEIERVIAKVGSQG